MTAPPRIGTTGFAYRDWVGPFYPPGARPQALFGHYARQLAAVELPGALHRLPSPAQVDGWVAEAGPSFRLCLTAPRALTGDLRIARHAAALATLRRLVERLGGRAGPVLVRLPATLPVDLTALRHFLDALGGLRVAVELRDPSWRSDACLRALSAHGAALVVSDESAGLPRVELTGDTSYWRLGPAGSEAAWEAWAERAALLARRGVELFAFVRHDRGLRAVERALALQQRIDRLLARSAPALESRVYP